MSLAPLTLDPNARGSSMHCVAVGNNAQAIGYGSVVVGDNLTVTEDFGVVSGPTVMTLENMGLNSEEREYFRQNRDLIRSRIEEQIANREKLPYYPTKEEQIFQLRRALQIFDAL